jgi:FMN-dependent NADH-azoreductase
MTRLLHVSVSARGAASHSRRVAGDLIAALRRAGRDIAVVERDLAAEPLPHPDAPFVAANLTPPDARDDAARQALALSETLIGELEAADTILLSTPMHNFTVPSALKAWLDHVVRPGRTFRITPAGKVGLLERRPVLAIVACGGRFEGSLLGGVPGAQEDFLSDYLRYVLGIVGLADVDVLRLEALNRGPEKVEAGMEAARRWIERQVAHLS